MNSSSTQGGLVYKVGTLLGLTLTFFFAFVGLVGILQAFNGV